MYERLMGAFLNIYQPRLNCIQSNKIHYQIPTTHSNMHVEWSTKVNSKRNFDFNE